MPSIRISLLLFSFSLLYSHINAQEAALRKEQPVPFILRQFDEHPIVALGETHGNANMHALYESLVRNGEFQSKVKNIVVEYGNALYQPLIDDYTSGKNMTMDSLRIVWRNLMVSTMLQYGADQFEQLFRSVREVNSKLPKSEQIRILAGGPPIDWDSIKTVQDFIAFQKANSRDVHYGEVIVNQVLKKQEKALLISGSAHLKKTSTIAQVIKRDLPELESPVYYIFPMVNFGEKQVEVIPELGAYTQPGIIPLKGTWLGQIEKPLVVKSANVWMEQVEDGSTEEGDMHVVIGADGKKKVFKVINGNRNLIAKEGGMPSNGNKMLGSAPKNGTDANKQNAESDNTGPSPLMLPEGVWRRTYEDKGRTLFEVCDALLWVEHDLMPAPESIWKDDAFWDTLDRRMIMLTGEKLDPRVRNSKGKFGEHH